MRSIRTERPSYKYGGNAIYDLPSVPILVTESEVKNHPYPALEAGARIGTKPFKALEEGLKVKKHNDRFNLSYIGGTTEEARNKFWQNRPKIKAATDSIARRYGINPQALRYRINHEGFVDSQINIDNTAYLHPYASRYTSDDDLLRDERLVRSGFTSFGLDTTGELINKGKVKLINENWYSGDEENEKGQQIHTAEGATNLDNIGLTAATLRYFANEVRKDYPNLSNSEVNRYALAYYNRGLEGGRKWAKQGAQGYQYKYGGRIYIKPENRGKFTALKERTGHSATWFKENGTPAQRKMATFALNARKWKH